VVVAQKPDAEEPIETVIARLAGTPDGRRLFTFLLEEAVSGNPPNATDAALREAEGARRLVMKLREMAQPKG